MGQTVLALGQNLLEILEKYNNKPYVFFIKVDQIFIKGQYGSARFVPDSSFSKDAWNRNKTQAFDGKNPERMLERISLKIDENA